MSAFDARSAMEVNIPQWSQIWFSEDFIRLTIICLNVSYSPTRQIEMLEGHKGKRTEILGNKQARKNTIACEQTSPTRQIEMLEGRRDRRIDRLKLRATNKLDRM